MRRKLAIALAVSVAVFEIGLLGAWAFNPDNGSVAHSAALWRLFGIPGELSVPAFAVIALLLTVSLVAGLARTTCRRFHA